jgi:hypothetical protein
MSPCGRVGLPAARSMAQPPPIHQGTVRDDRSDWTSRRGSKPAGMPSFKVLPPGR